MRVAIPTIGYAEFDIETDLTDRNEIISALVLGDIELIPPCKGILIEDYIVVASLAHPDLPSGWPVEIELYD